MGGMPVGGYPGMPMMQPVYGGAQLQPMMGSAGVQPVAGGTFGGYGGMDQSSSMGGYGGKPHRQGGYHGNHYGQGGIQHHKSAGG